MTKKYEDMTDLEKMTYFNEERNRAWRRLENDLIKFSYKVHYEDENYWIEADNKLIYQGIISMKTHNSLKRWFKEYHELFKEAFQLKLIRIYKTESIGNGRTNYQLDYTYDDNPRFEEVKPQIIRSKFL